LAEEGVKDGRGMEGWEAEMEREEEDLHIHVTVSIHLPGFCRDTVEAAWGVNYSKQ